LRYADSTIHNLFELLFVRDLCGTFCFSMQFVVLVDLVGTLALPAAITFTLYIVIISIIPSQPTPTMSLILLALILGLPALLIVITSRKIACAFSSLHAPSPCETRKKLIDLARLLFFLTDVGWMLIYLCSLPIWNFVLPVYAYWHFDDFSWGETRKIEGEGTGKPETGHGDKEGVFDSTSIVMKVRLLPSSLPELERGQD
jgi:chitin synthase